MSVLFFFKEYLIRIVNYCYATIITFTKLLIIKILLSKFENVKIQKFSALLKWKCSFRLLFKKQTRHFFRFFEFSFVFCWNILAKILMNEWRLTKKENVAISAVVFEIMKKNCFDSFLICFLFFLFCLSTTFCFTFFPITFLCLYSVSSLCPSVHLSVFRLVCLSVCLSVYLSICLSV